MNWRGICVYPITTYQFLVLEPLMNLKITVAAAALALGGWLAFKQMGQGAMVMGDLVLAEDEVAPITAKLQAAGYRVGLALVLGLMLFATWNDLQQLPVSKLLGHLPS